jgi:chemotaxis signal transduction protein
VTERQAALDIARLRRDFDASFALPDRSVGALVEEFLLIRADERPYALALAELREVVVGVTVTRVPATTPALLGVAGLRGQLVPVFDLGALLGGRAAEQVPRWLALAAGAEPLGFAFAALEGHLQRQADDEFRAAGVDEGFLRGALRSDGFRPLIALDRMVAALRESDRHAGPGKER